MEPEAQHGETYGRPRARVSFNHGLSTSRPKSDRAEVGTVWPARPTLGRGRRGEQVLARALAAPALLGTQTAVLVLLGVALALRGAVPARDQAGLELAVLDRRVGAGLAGEERAVATHVSAQSRQRRRQRSMSRTSSSASDASAQIVQCPAHSPHSSTHRARTPASATSGRGWVWRMASTLMSAKLPAPRGRRRGPAFTRRAGPAGPARAAAPRRRACVPRGRRRSGWRGRRRPRSACR